MSPLLIKSQIRYLTSRWWLVLVSVLGIAVGVAGPTSMDLTISSCRRGFELSTLAVSGRATHSIQPSGDTFSEELYRKLRLDLQVRPSAPVVEGAVTYLTHGKEHSLRVLGLDPFVESDFRGELGITGAASVGIGDLLSEANTGVMSRRQATREGLREGDKIELLGGTKVKLVALLDPADDRSAQALEGLLLVDISTAQELLAKVGRLSRIDLILPGGAAGAEQEARIRKILPEGVELAPAGQRTMAIREMTSAFFLNLQALSMLSLLVGALLVYNVSRFLVVERKLTLGRLRTLGVTDRELLTLIVGECLCLAFTGIVLGELAGWGLARVLLGLVAQTINDLYYAIEVSQIHLDRLVLLKGALLGTVSALAAVWGPARAALRAPLGQGLGRSSFFEESQRWLDRAGLIGLSMAVLGWITLVLAKSSLLLSLVGLTLTILGMACLTPWAVRWLNRQMLRLLRKRLPVLLRLAFTSIERDLDWTGVALATLTIAISATISIGLMVFSFRGSLNRWLEQALQADVYVSLTDRNAAKSGRSLDPQLVESLKRLTEVSAWTMLRVSHVVTSTRPGEPAVRANLFALDVAAQGETSYPLMSGDPRQAWPEFRHGDLLISDPFAYRYHVAVGQQLTLETPQGPVQLRVAGIFSDYTSETGYVMVDLQRYRTLFHDDGVSGMAAFLKPGVDPARVVEEIRGLPHAGAVEAHSNRSLRELSLVIFDRTFQVTAVLRYLAITVALVGIFGALGALQLARRRDMALYQALGLTPGQAAGLQLIQTVTAGLWAGLFAVPAGVCEAYAMVVFINRRAFGWSLTFALEPGLLLQAPLLALLASGLAGLAAAGVSRRAALSTRLQEE